MKTILLIMCIMVSVISCNGITGNHSTEKENADTLKALLARNQSDTLWVSQDDTTVFHREVGMIHRPCSRPEVVVEYELIHPRDSAYYLIYNDKGLLIMEGRYRAKYISGDIVYDQGNFYTYKSYHYKRNALLETIHYMEDGRNLKIEHFNRKGRLMKIRYFDKKSSDTEKIEIYKKGRLKETRVYTSFDKYYTIKADK